MTKSDIFVRQRSMTKILSPPPKKKYIFSCKKTCNQQNYSPSFLLSKREEVITPCDTPPPPRPSRLFSRNPVTHPLLYTFKFWKDQDHDLMQSKHETFTQCRYNVGPPSATLAQHCTGIGWTSRVLLGYCSRRRCQDTGLSTWSTTTPTDITHHSHVGLLTPPQRSGRIETETISQC